MSATPMFLAMTKAVAMTVALVAAAAMAQTQSDANVVTVKIAPQNDSGQKGTMTMTPEGNSTRVVINIEGAPNGASQPAHIHEGSCAKLDPKPKYGLQNVEYGKSTTLVPAPIAQLTTGALAVNVHKSAQQADQYVACGDIKGAK